MASLWDFASPELRDEVLAKMSNRQYVPRDSLPGAAELWLLNLMAVQCAIYRVCRWLPIPRSDCCRLLFCARSRGNGAIADVFVFRRFGHKARIEFRRRRSEDVLLGGHNMADIVDDAIEKTS